MAQSYNITTNSASTTQVRFLAPKDYDSTDIYMVNGGLRQLKQVDGNPIVHGWVTGAPLVFNLGEDGISMYMDINDVGGGSEPVAVSSLEVGSILKLKKSDGSEVEYLVVHQGLPDTTLYDTSCDGTWVLRKDILERMTWDSTDNDYANSDIYSYLNSTFYNLFDDTTKNAIKRVKIPFVNGTGTGGSVSSGINGLSSNVFLLGGYEVGFSISDDTYFPIDGVKLDYFDAGTGSAAMARRVANYHGAEGGWYLRSPDTGTTNDVWSVNEYGYYYSSNYSNLGGIRPAMVLYSNSTATENEDGSYTLVSGGGNYEPVNPTPEPEPEPEPDPILSNNDWETIAKVAEAGEGSQHWNIGDTIDIQVGDEALTFAIMDFNHDDLVDGTGKAGITFGMTKRMTNGHRMNPTNTNAGSFVGSEMYVYLRDTILPTMPQEVQNVIKEVNKKTSAGNQSTSIRADNMSIWLFSAAEVGLSASYVSSIEGTAYPYFNNTTRDKGGIWWLRSPRLPSNDAFICVASGSSLGNVNASTSTGVSFGFCV